MRPTCAWLLSTALGLIALCVTSADASIVRPYSFEEITQRADRIALVRVAGESARWDAHRRIVTDYVLTVDEPLKGTSRSESLVMTRVGGVIGDIGLRVEGEASLQVGSRYVVFLEHFERAQMWRAVGMSQGIFPIDDSSGRVTSGMTSLAYYEGSADRKRDRVRPLRTPLPRTSMPLADFLTLVRSAL